MAEFDAILFDFDGVLADTEPIHCACWAEALAPLGISLDWETYQREFVGLDDREMARILAARCHPPRPWEELWENAYPAKRTLFRARTAAAPPFPPGLRPFLDGLDGKYKLAVVTSSSSAEIQPILAAGGLLPCFQTLVGGESVARHKPAPEPYLLAAERLGARSPLVVEDSPAGIASGQAAGFEVLAVSNPMDVPGQVLERLAGGPV